jgi:thioredoxin 1
MTPTLFIYLLIGGGVGAGLGYFGSCKSGACPLTANWRRGALYGAVMGLLFYSTSGGAGNSTAMNQSTANVKHVSEAEFDTEVTQSALPVIVDFYATWCGPCRQLAPTMDSLAEQYAGKIKFVKVNVDESPKLAQKFQVEGIPMLVFLQQGKTAGTSVGLVAKEDLILRLDSLLQTNAQPAAAGR